MMSLISKRELTLVVSLRYRSASRADKGRILDEFVATTGYDRKYAIQQLNHPPPEQHRPQKRLKARRYTPLVKAALVQIWQASGGLCSKRLVPALPLWVEALERHGELHLDPETQALLVRLSPATADRLLTDQRRRRTGRGLSTTKPGTLLKRQIPIRTFAEWDDVRPGFVDIDLVAHCGTTTAGEYLHSLVATDIATGWTECEALPNRSQRVVLAAVERIRTRLPFPLLGIDSDNGSEFINAPLVKYCASVPPRR